MRVAGDVDDEGAPSHNRAPLLGDVDHRGDLAHVEQTHLKDSDEGSHTKVSAFLWILSCSAALSGLLFGYDTGVISSTLVNIRSDLGRELTTLDKSLITSITSLTALAASSIAPLIADALGRKTVMFVADLLFIIGAIWQALSRSTVSLILGRAIVGLAVGAASFIVPIYISELSPGIFRGRLVTIYSLFLTGGQVVAYFIGWFFSYQPGGWKWMVGLGAIPAVVQIVMLLAVPETPRWLMMVGQRAKALEVLRKTYGDQEDTSIISRLVGHIEAQLIEAQTGSNTPRDNKKGFLDLRLRKYTHRFGSLVSVGRNRRALVIACLLQGCQQLVGFNSLMYFSATIFSVLGFSSPTLTSLSIAITNFVFTVAAFFTIDRLGRRRSLLWSIPVMSLALVSCAIGFRYADLQGTASTNSDASSPEFLAKGEGTQFWPYMIVLSTVVYTSAYAIGLGCVPWQQSELFPLQVRAVGTGIATATNWAANFLVGFTFLPLMDSITPSGTFLLYTASCMATWGAVWLLYPETACLNLEDVNHLLTSGWGVKKSMERWRAYRSSPISS